MIRNNAADYAEFQYRMEHDPEFKKSVEEGRAFLEADHITPLVRGRQNGYIKLSAALP